MSAAPAETPPKFGEILQFWAPVALTGQLLTLSQPVINAGVGASAGGEPALAAYFLALHVNVLTNSAILPGLNVATALVRDKNSYRVVRSFLLMIGLVVGAACVALGATSLGDRLFGEIMGQRDPDLVRGARDALVLLAFGAPAIAIRGAQQGAALAQRSGGRLAFATLFRLGVIWVVVKLGADAAGWRGEIAGSAAVVVGLWTEVLSLAWQARRTPGALPERGAGTATFASVARFMTPLTLGHLAWTLQRPIINAILGTAEDREASVAAFGVLHALTLFVSAPLWAFQTTAIVYGRTAPGRRAMIRFAVAASFFVSATTAGIFLLIGPETFLSSVFSLKGRALGLGSAALLIVALDPLVHGLRSTCSGFLIGAGRTKAAGLATTVKVLLTLAAGAVFTAAGPDVNGAALGMSLYVAGTALDLVVLALLARRTRPAA